MVFFAKDKFTAILYSRKVAKKEGLQYVEPKLAKGQIHNVNGLKTWTQGWR